MPNPQRDLAGLKRLRRYLKHPRTLDDIETKFGMSRRTTYRWLDYLLTDGVDILSRKDLKNGGRVFFVP